MTISLPKGGNVSLSRSSPGLTRIQVGLGWNARSNDGAAFDLDASAFLLGDNGKVRSDDDFIFYNQKESPEGSVRHLGDDTTGFGDGDNEEMHIDLTLLPAGVHSVVVSVTIHEADVRRQNFGMVGGAYVRVVNMANRDEIVRFDLSEDFSVETAVIFGEVYRQSGEWQFRAVGQGFPGGLAGLCRKFGVDI
jgi:tellurium resistance protein TerD